MLSKDNFLYYFTLCSTLCSLSIFFSSLFIFCSYTLSPSFAGTFLCYSLSHGYFSWISLCVVFFVSILLINGIVKRHKTLTKFEQNMSNYQIEHPNKTHTYTQTCQHQPKCIEQFCDLLVWFGCLRLFYDFRFCSTFRLVWCCTTHLFTVCICSISVG